MKTLRFMVMALAFGMIDAALSSCEQDNEGVVEQGQDNNENPDDNQNSDNNESDWDDDTMEISSSNHPSHTLTTHGIYTTTINGEAKRLNSNTSTDFIAGTQYLTIVKQWGNIGLTSMNGAFYGCQNLTSLSAETGDAFVDVTTFKYAFHYCGTETIPSDLFTKCLKAEEFSYCFDSCFSLTSISENLFMGCSAVTNFSHTFKSCSSLEGESPYTEMEMNGEKVNIHLYERGDYAVDMRWANPSGGGCFTGRTNLTDYSPIPSGWK